MRSWYVYVGTPGGQVKRVRVRAARALDAARIAESKVSRGIALGASVVGGRR